jgi:glycosyltransferase involved in cell wall biosynthesis
LIHGLDCGGAELTLHKTLTGIPRAQFPQEVVSLREPGAVGRMIRDAGVAVHSLHMRRGVPSLRGAVVLGRLLARLRPSILHCWSYHSALLGTLAASALRVPRLIWNIRSANPTLQAYSRLSVYTVKACAALSRLPWTIIVNSRHARRVHRRWGYRPRRWDFIPNGFDLERFMPDAAARASVRAELGIPSGAVLVGIVGRYHPLKDHRTGLEAAALLLKGGKHAHFLLAGTGTGPDNAVLSALAGEEPLRGKVHLLGERSDVPRIMAALDLLALPSRSEAFPNVVGEAMACGVPCVVTDVGDARAMVGSAGLVVPPGDAEALAGGLARLIDAGAEARERLGRWARERVRENYSLDAMVRRYEALYGELAGEGEPQRCGVVSPRCGVVS